MKLRYKLLGGFLAVSILAFASLGMYLSHEGDCRELPALTPGVETMRAVVYRCYGTTEVLELVELDKPSPGPDRVLVRVHAASVNPLDWHYMTGLPYVMRLEAGVGAPRDIRLGVDFAGVVEAIGSNVTKFAVGDAVFGGSTGAFGEYVTVREDRAIAKIPADRSFAEAASVGIAGITALQALRDRGGVEPGDRVLINGASGGVGSFAVQIAKSFGAEVTGVASSGNLELLRALGADHVIDYRQEDFVDSERRWDVVLDNVGNFSPWRVAGVLEPDGVLVLVGGPKGDWFAPLVRPIQAFLYSPFLEPKMGAMLAVFRQADLETLARLMADGSLQPVVDREFPLAQVADALEYWKSGDGYGKTVIRVVPSP